MKKLINKFRMFSDINIYLGKKKLFDFLIWLLRKITSGLYISIAVTIYYIYLNFHDLFELNGIIPLVIGYGINLISYLIDANEKKEIEVLSHDKDLKSVKLNKVYKENDYNISSLKIIKGNELSFNINEQYYASSELINNAIIDLQKQNLDIEIESSINHEKDYKNYINENWSELKKLLLLKYTSSVNNNKLFINEKKLCLSESLTTTRLIKTGKVYIHKGDYYGNYLTNILAGRKVMNLVNGKIISSPITNAYPIDANNLLYSLEASNMCNEIGVSTIVIFIDKDGVYHIPLPRQNNRNQIGTELIISSATGGADYKDIQNNELFKSIKHSMERELQEELYKHVELKEFLEKTKTIITGYHRWINHGGKPEFTGVTFLYSKDIFKTSKSELQDGVIELKITSKELFLTNLESVLSNNLDFSLSGYCAVKNLMNYIRNNRDHFHQLLPVKTDIY